MAKINNTFFFKLALVLTLVLMISVAEGLNRGHGIGFGKKAKSTLVCNSIYGTETDDTCTTVAQAFNLSLDDFLAINPNINCASIFVGQWLCVDGSA